MGRRPKRRVTAVNKLGSCVSTRLSSIWINVYLAKGTGTIPYPHNPDLLRFILHALVCNLGYVDKKREAEVRRCLLMLVARELMIDNDEFKYSRENYDRRIQKSSLCSDPAIKDLVKRLAAGKPQRDKHDIELLKFQRELVLEYMDEHEFPKYLENPDNALKLLQDWMDEHAPVLIPRLSVVSCGCGAPSKSIALPELHSTHLKTNPRHGVPPDKMLLAILAHLHNTSPKYIDKLLNRPSSAHSVFLT